MLDILFIILTLPPRSIQLEGLPPNIILITRQPCDILCSMSNGKLVKIWRDQVLVVPNFAMTDFNSQSRTYSSNVTDIYNCQGHQSVYTCLSRGSTYDGTLIVQGFNAFKI